MSAATAYNQMNPFTPMFGKVPAYMAGRELIIENMVQAFDVAGSNPDLCSIFVGARGTGKTALLTYLGHRAEQMGWIVASATASNGMLDDIEQRVRASSAHLISATSSKKLAGANIASLGGISWENIEPSANWRSRMNLILDQLNEANTGLVISVDEIDPSIPEMVELVTTYQHFVRENRKVALIMAGLPYKVSALLSGKTTSFLRRAARHNLGSIPDYEVKEAFRLTVEDGGKRIDDDALDLAASAIGGFPFMFQLVGYRSWNAARKERIISVEHVRQGSQIAKEEFDSRVLEATYAELSKGDISFLQTMNEEGETSRAEIAERVGKKPAWVSTYKKRLLEAGVIEEPSPGVFEYALPGMGEYLQNRG